jgi:hypothetical protein
VRTRMIFQYLAPGSKEPEETRIAPAYAELRAEDSVPNVGDIITMQSQPHAQGSTTFERFKVVSRNFWYTWGGRQMDELVDCQIFLIVTLPDEDDITHVDE